MFYDAIPKIAKNQELENNKDLGESPVLKSRKRSLSPTEATLLGILPKHTTTIKKSQDVRRRLNQTFFVGSPTNEISLCTQDLSKNTPERTRKKRKVKRKLTEDNKQLLITSAFTPKSMKGGMLDHEESIHGDSLPVSGIKPDEL